ncbi:MAG: 4Fe-4S dicluster domain-containing protein [Bacteroidales bacterium]|nr:4Fe-4S dicluster domain-containing protein [Candidatus Colimorpha pelethequi]
MTDFGFSISKSATIDMDAVDMELYERVCRQVPSARICMSCGSCSASCVAAPYSGMSVRKVILALQRGKDVRTMLSNCMLCGKCSMACPRGVNTRNLILTVCRNL